MLLMAVFAFHGSAQRSANERNATSSEFLEKGKKYQFLCVSGANRPATVEEYKGGNWVKVKVQGQAGWINLDNVTTISVE